MNKFIAALLCLFSVIYVVKGAWPLSICKDKWKSRLRTLKW